MVPLLRVGFTPVQLAGRCYRPGATPSVRGSDPPVASSTSSATSSALLATIVTEKHPHFMILREFPEEPTTAAGGPRTPRPG